MKTHFWEFSIFPKNYECQIKEDIFNFFIFYLQNKKFVIQKKKSQIYGNKDRKFFGNKTLKISEISQRVLTVKADNRNCEQRWRDGASRRGVSKEATLAPNIY